MKCSRCTSAAVVQWSKLLDEEQVDAHLVDLAQKLAAQAEETKLRIRFRLAALQEARESPPKDLSPADTQRFQERADLQISAAQEEHEAVQTVFDLEHHRAGSCRALGHCEEHRIPDPEWYARVHSASCTDSEGCGCS